MSNILVINAAGQETRVALIEQGIISEYYLERKNEKGIVGNIYKGRVVRVLPGMQAAFVDIGLDKAAFLYVADIVSDPNFPGFGEELEEQASSVEGDPLERDDVAEPSEDTTPAPVPVEALGAPSADVNAAGPALMELAQASAAPAAAPSPEEKPPLVAAPESPSEESKVLELSEEDVLEEDEEEEEDEGDEEPLDEGDAAHAAAEAELAAEAAAAPDGSAVAAPPVPTGETQPASTAAAPALPTAFGQRGLPPEQRPASRERRGRRRGGRGRKRNGDGQRPPAEAHGQPGRSERRGGDRDRQPQQKGESNGKARANGQGRRAQIQDLLKEGDEVLVQVVKDPIGSKGARITCHISLPGRHLVFMPTVDHVGISRRIENEKERRRLRELVDKYRPQGTGFIVRTVAEAEPSEKLTADIKFLLGLWSEVGKKLESMRAPALIHPDLDLILRSIRDLFSDEVNKVVIDDRAEYERVRDFVAQVAPELKDSVELYQGDDPIFDEFGIEQELIRASNRKVWLKSGGYIIIDQTEALVAIDVNSGRYTGKKSLEETITKINCEAAKEIVYQLRLRNIGGIIIIDFIDMDKGANREKVFKTLQEALQADRAKTNVLKISDIGLVEMTRKRVRESVGRLMNEGCPVCDGRGYVRSKVTMAYDIMREAQRAAKKHREDQLVVNCHPEVAKFLQGPEREALRLLMMRLNKSIVVRAQPQYHVEQYDLFGKWSRPELQQQGRSGVRRDDGRGSRREREQQREAAKGEPAQPLPTGEERLETKVGD